MLSGKRVFVSGGNGVIGKELVELLHSQGAELLVGDLKPRPRWWSADIRYRQGDLNEITAGELDDFAPEYFFHLAATFERSVESYEFWYENHRHNMQLGAHLMTLLKDSAHLRKVVNCSSYLVYDPELYSFDKPAETAFSLREDAAVFPRNLTGMAKLYHEIELRFLNGFKRDSYKSVSARIYRSYGKHSRDIVSRWIRMLLAGEALTVYKPEGLFDYVYAGDVAEGLVRLAACDEAEGVFNLATGKAQRVSDILAALKTHFPDMRTVNEDVDIPYEASEANMDRFESLIGWKPTRRLADVIPMMIEHEKRHGSEDDSRAGPASLLITSLSGKVPLIRAAQSAAAKFGSGARVFGGDINADCLGRRFADGFWHMPRIDALTAAEVVEYCQANGISGIIPTRDAELPFWAGHRAELADHGISVMVSGPEPVAVCLDKLRFFESARTAGFPVIPASRDVDAIDASHLVVKEQFGAGARSIGIDLDREQALAHAMALEQPIFQPFIDGSEISIDLYVDRSGAVKGVVLRTRDSVVNGESQVTTTFRDEAIESTCAELAQSLGLYGHAVIQAFMTDDGGLHIIECNGRIGGASMLSLTAGLDSLYWFALEAAGEDIGSYPFVRASRPVRQVRFPQDSYDYP